jgi:[ribosomal protein S5]-alanine N-acetyltransferase
MSRMLDRIHSGSPGEGQYFLRSQRLGFRPWSDTDIDLAMGLWGDPEVTRLIGGPFSIEQVRERLAREMATLREHGVQYWPVFLLATEEHAGCCGVRPYRVEDKVYELGSHLRKAHWGRGYALEAARAVIGHAFTALGATALFAGHHPANEVSRRLLTALGFAYTHDEYYAPTGLCHPSYLLRAEAAAALGYATAPHS